MSKLDYDKPVRIFEIHQEVIQEALALSLHAAPTQLYYDTRMVHPRKSIVTLHMEGCDWLRAVGAEDDRMRILQGSWFEDARISVSFENEKYLIGIGDGEDIREIYFGRGGFMRDPYKQAIRNLMKIFPGTTEKRTLNFRECLSFWAFGGMRNDIKEFYLDGNVKDPKDITASMIVTQLLPMCADVINMLIQDSNMRYTDDNADVMDYVMTQPNPDRVEHKSTYIDLERITAPSIRTDHSGRKHGEHEVLGHWCYSQKDGDKDCIHQWEQVHPNRQRCTKCNQLRWWRNKHVRGDAAYGTIIRTKHEVRPE